MELAYNFLISMFNKMVKSKSIKMSGQVKQLAKRPRNDVCRMAMSNSWPIGHQIYMAFLLCNSRGQLAVKFTWQKLHVNLVANWPRKSGELHSKPIPLATRLTCDFYHVNLMANWPPIRHGHATNIVSWPIGQLLNLSRVPLYLKI